MKKYLILTVLAVIVAVFLPACTGTVGPIGPEGENLLVMYFQDSVYPDKFYSENENTGVYEQWSNSYFSDEIGHWCGAYSVYRERVLFYFNVSGSLPANAVVKKAYLVLYCEDLDGAGTPSLALYRAVKEWDSLEATWNNRLDLTPWDQEGGDYYPTAVSNTLTLASASQYYTWELKASFVQGWVDGTADNYGMILKSINETVEEDAYLSSNVSLVPEHKPRLVVYYSVE